MPTEQLDEMCAMAAAAIKHATQALLIADLSLAETVIAKSAISSPSTPTWSKPHRPAHRPDG